MAVHHIGCLRLENTAAFALDLAKAVDGVAQRVDDTAQEPVTDRHRKHFAGAADFLPLFDADEIAEDNHADFAGVQIERQAKGAVLEGQQLVSHATRQPRHMRNAVTSGGDVAHFLGRRVGWLVRIDKVIERLAYRGGINGQFCHDHSLVLCIHSLAVRAWRRPA